MLDWTDRHCRYFHRLLTRRTRLYTEMVTTAALVHGDRERHLEFDPSEHPLALQLGGSDPAELAQCARWAEERGYDEVDLNCGCPSERVQRGAFGACLMAEPALVRDCLAAMRDAVSIPVTIKHRIGIDRRVDYAFVRDFVGAVSASGVEVFIVHARSAWLDGLSPKENRELPPLRHEFVHALKRDFAHLRFVVNGGLGSLDEAAAHLDRVDGAMLGRAAYRDPWLLAAVDERLFGAAAPVGDRFELVDPLVRYAREHVARGGRVRDITRHLLGLFNGMHGARAWRRMLSDANALAENDPSLIDRAAREVSRPGQLDARDARTNASVATKLDTASSASTSASFADSPESLSARTAASQT
ncbi:MAG: tRNA dihydrouridine(20/20a) synthase DusA [Burkholderiaceae bacterium]|nr:tRNA dihydrouridine(20/20a) synthase DusA [Burkholderiaceae bacterium]